MPCPPACVFCRAFHVQQSRREQQPKPTNRHTQQASMLRPTKQPPHQPANAPAPLQFMVVGRPPLLLNSIAATTTGAFIGHYHHLTFLPRASFLRASAAALVMCAWFCSGRSNTELINRLRSANVITSERVREVMLAVDRGNYAPDRPYDDSPQYLGFEQTISAPHMHAHALELLKDKLVPGASVLDVGCGSGYLTACMARMVAPGGHVHGIDIVPGLVEMSRENLLKADSDLLQKGIVTLAPTSGWEGAKAHAPYDAIHVGAAAASVPRHLVEQLKVGGLMIIPVGPDGGNQALYRIEKVREGGPVEESFVAQELMGVRYVPLVRGSPYAKKDK